MGQTKVVGSILGLWLLSWGSAGCGTEAEPTDHVQLGVGGQIGFIAEADTMLIAQFPDLDYGNAGLCIANGAGVGERACLVRWNLSSIPTNVQVNSANFSFYVTNGSVDSFKLFEMVRSWGEPAATWNQAAAGVPWGTPGAKAASDRDLAFASFPSSTKNTFVNIPVSQANLSIIQGWIQNPSQNHGIQIARIIAQDDLTIASSEAVVQANRPRLNIAYSFPGGAGGGGP